MTTETITWQEALGVAEKLPWADQLRLITELLLRIQPVVAKSEAVDLLTLAGVGAEVWAKVDTKQYIDQERDSWKN